MPRKRKQMMQGKQKRRRGEQVKRKSQLSFTKILHKKNNFLQDNCISGMQAHSNSSDTKQWKILTTLLAGPGFNNSQLPPT